MPIGIISKEDFDKEVGNNITNISARSVVITDPAKGRGNKPEVPEEIRNVIAQEALLGTPVSEIAKEFNISPSSIAAYKNGATSTTTYNEGDKKLKRANNIFKDRIVRRAGKLSITALDSIDENDFRNASLTDKANVAKQMASIVRDMTPEDSRGNESSNVQIVIHAPAMRRDDDYINGQIVSID